MIYAAIAHEVMQRLRWHAKPGGMLEGMTVKDGHDFEIDGEDNLPLVAPTDFMISGGASGKSSGEFTIFVRTRLSAGFATVEEGKRGLMNWVEAVMDAVETPPSAPDKPDFLLTAHKVDGTAINSNVQLLSEGFTWDVRMSAVSDLSYLMQLTMRMSHADGRRANRRGKPTTPQDYT